MSIWLENFLTGNKIFMSLNVPIYLMLGADATEVFLDIGHSQDAELLMKNYYIGDLCNDSW